MAALLERLGFGGARAAPPPAVVAPLPNQNQQDAVGVVTRATDARLIFQAHKDALQVCRQRDLISEKLLLHIDGSGDLQWFDIYKGSRLAIPRGVSSYRKTENILRLVVDNAVAHHTTMPLRYFAEALADRRSKEQAIVDMLWANYLAQQQDLNGLYAEAMYLAMPAGFCPVHRYWREDAHDYYEPGGYGMAPGGEAPDISPSAGMLDCFLGNPFDHVFNRSARRGSVRWGSYGRMLDGDLVRDTFSHVPGIAGLEGTTKLPSAAEFQMIAREWRMESMGTHGSPVYEQARQSASKGEDMIAVICRETAPGVLGRDDPGRLQIIAVPGLVDSRRGEGNAGHAVLLADQPLPAGDFSWTLFYSHHRGSDIRGKPWVEDIDQIQVDLNIALSKRWECVNRMIEAPIVAPGGAISEDMVDLGGYNLLEVEPSLAGWRPQVMTWPEGVLAALNTEIEDRRRAIYTGGGYQASSRGEAPGSRMAYRAIVALQQADNSIHGPVNMRFRTAACDFMRGCWRQMKTYGDVPWLVNITGDEFAHLAEPYIDNTKLSDQPPTYKLVNAFGASPELRAQEVLELMQTRGADGKPFLLTEEARRQYPNQQVFDDAGNPAIVMRRRARTIQQALFTESKKLRAATGFDENDISQPLVQQAGMQVFMLLEVRYPRLRDDDLLANLACLSEVTQDETADAIARWAAIQRQNLLYEWQMMQAGMAMGDPAVEAEGPGVQRGQGGQMPGPGDVDRQGVAAEVQGGDPPGAMTAR